MVPVCIRSTLVHADQSESGSGIAHRPGRRGAIASRTEVPLAGNEWLELIDVAGLHLEALHGGSLASRSRTDSGEYVFIARR